MRILIQEVWGRAEFLMSSQMIQMLLDGKPHTSGVECDFSESVPQVCVSQLWLP